MTDWSQQRGVATEPAIDRFIASLGGERVDRVFPQATFRNADYVFRDEKIIIELKVLETEFGATEPFLAKEARIQEQVAGRFSFGSIIRGEVGPARFYAKAKYQLYRAPLGRIIKTANRQLRETREALADNDYLGVLWLVNDNFRHIGSDLTLALLCSNLVGQYSSVHGLIYVTNHYVHLPGSDLANLLWVPAYAESVPERLPDFVNWLGGRWGDFCEQELGPFEGRSAGPDISLIGARPIV